MKNKATIGGAGLGGVLVTFAFAGDESDIIKGVCILGAIALVVVGRWMDRPAK